LEYEVWGFDGARDIGVGSQFQNDLEVADFVEG
jgi:hypothetical protein